MYEIEERDLADQPTMVVHRKVKLEDIPTFLGRVYHTVESQVHAAGAHVVGAPFARYRPLDTEFREFEIEAGVAVIVAVPGHGEVEASHLPGGPAAVTTHIGPYERMEPGYAALEGWMEDRDVEPTGPAWEVYYTDTDDQPDPGAWRTEIVQPYRDAG